MDLLSSLNDRQKEAVKCLEGPLLIIAGAGSGKTRALTHRIAYLIETGLAQPWQILALTFTNKAAGEMQDRINALLSENFDLASDNRPRIGTFHSICVSILRKYAEFLGREKTFIIYDSLDQKSLMKRLIKENDIDDEQVKYQVVLGMISKFKNQLKTAEEFSAKAGNYFEKQVSLLFLAYEKRLKDNNAFDFDDLIFYVVKLFREHPEALEFYQERWRYISIDEYQDTNYAQYILAKLLVSRYHNLCVIGDSDQSIYSFRGADISNILNFEKDYSDAKVIKLEQNYRSTQIILDAADAVISKNTHRKAKKMWTEKEGGDLIEITHSRAETDEANFVLTEIERLKSSQSVDLKDIVVLYRTNAQSRILEEAFLRYAVPYKVIGGLKFYARKEIKDILAYLRIIHNPNDSDSLLRIINTPSRRIGQSTIMKLQAFALERSLTLSELFNHVEMLDNISPRTKLALSQFWTMILDFQKSNYNLKPSELLRKIVKDIGFKKYLMDGTEEGSMRYENVMELISVASKYDDIDFQFALASFLEEVSLVADTDQIDTSNSHVTLMTLHSVKGLEYDYVFIVGCEESIFPHSRSLFSDHEMEEERRLMYVGMTRAKSKLYLLAAKNRMLYGEYKHNAISRFIDDIPKELVVLDSSSSVKNELGSLSSDTLSSNTFSENKIEISNFQKVDEDLSDGDRVMHVKYGKGMVVEKRGGLISIAFDDRVYGIKKFVMNIVSLKKL